MEITKIEKLAVNPRRDVSREDAPLQPIEEMEKLYASISCSAEEAVGERQPAGGQESCPTGDKIFMGGRNNFLTHLAGAMRRKGMGEESIFAALMAENEERCEPSLSEDEVRGIARGIQRYTPADPFYDTPAPLRFPVEDLTPTLRRFIEEASSSTACPPEYIGVPMLTLLGAAIGNSLRLRLKSDWTEGTTVYSAIVGPPGDRKTPALKKASSPADKRQDKYIREYEEAMAQYNRRKREWEAEKRKASKEGTIAPEPPVKPTMRRTTVRDTTVEALAPRLLENPRGLVSVQDELASLLNGMNQYKGGKGNDEQFHLATWSNSPHSVDRKTQEPIIIRRPFLGITGGIQPDVLSDLKKKDRDDGWVDRFVFAYPESILGYWTDNEISEEVWAAYHRVYDRLCDLPVGVDENGSPIPQQVKLTCQARQVFIAEHDRLEDEIHSPGLPQHLRGPLAKMKSYLARFSLILAAVRWVEDEDYDVRSFQQPGECLYVTKRDVQAAAKLIQYFKSHAHRVHAKLRSEKPQNLLAVELKAFLREQGGRWEGMTAELYKVLAARSTPGLPGGSVPFGKNIRELVSQDDTFDLIEGHRGSSPIIKLSLSTPDAAAHEDGMDINTEGTDSTEGKNESEHADTGSGDTEDAPGDSGFSS